MAEVVAAAVAMSATRAPAISVEHAGKAARIRPDRVRGARDAARATLRPHNSARRVFVRQLLLAIADDIAPGLERGLGSSGPRASRRRALPRTLRCQGARRALARADAGGPRGGPLHGRGRARGRRCRASAVERELLPRPAAPGYTGRCRTGGRGAPPARHRRRQGPLLVAAQSRRVPATARDATAVVQVPGFVEIAVDGAAVAHRYADAAPSTASQAAGDDATWLFGHRRGRGAGALPDAVALHPAPLARRIDDDRRRHGAAERAGCRAVVGRRGRGVGD